MSFDDFRIFSEDFIFVFCRERESLYQESEKEIFDLKLEIWRASSNHNDDPARLIVCPTLSASSFYIPLLYYTKEFLTNTEGPRICLLRILNRPRAMRTRSYLAILKRHGKEGRLLKARHTEDSMQQLQNSL